MVQRGDKNQRRQYDQDNDSSTSLQDRTQRHRRQVARSSLEEKAVDGLRDDQYYDRGNAKEYM